MTIKEAIDSDYCILVDNRQDAELLLPYLRGGNLDFSYPIFAYAPESTRGKLGLGFQNKAVWQGNIKEIVNLKELTIKCNSEH